MPRRIAIACTGLLLLALTAGMPAVSASWSLAKQLGHPVNAVAGNARGEEAMLWQVETGRSVLRPADGYATGPIRDLPDLVARLTRGGQ